RSHAHEVVHIILTSCPYPSNARIAGETARGARVSAVFVPNLVIKRLSVLGSILIASSALSFAILTTDHDWGDDFAAYITQAISLLRGTENESIAHAAFAARQSSRYYGPIAAPWGFPAILAPVYRACGGLNIRCLKLVNIPFFAAF